MDKKPQNINWRLLFLTRRYLVSTVFSGLLAIMIAMSGVIPQFKEILELRSSIAGQQKKLKVLQQKAADLETIETSSEYVSHSRAVTQILPSKKPLLELLTSLSAIAGQNNISFSNLNLSPGEIASEGAELSKDTVKKAKVTDYDVMSVELKISGTFNNIQQFLLEIEKVAPLTSIMSLSLNVKGADILHADDLVNADLLLNTYYFTKSVKAALDAPLPVLDNSEQVVINEIQNYAYPVIPIQQQIISGNLEDLFGVSEEELLSF